MLLTTDKGAGVDVGGRRKTKSLGPTGDSPIPIEQNEGPRETDPGLSHS